MPRPDFDVLRHAVADRADAYREVLRAFADAKAAFLVHLRPEDVAERTGLARDEAARLLEVLEEWGNLRSDPDTGRVRSVEDFARRRRLYQLTAAGEAAEAAFVAFDAALGRRAELQAVALADIQLRLGALLRLADDASPDEAQVQLTLEALVSRFEALAENAQAFMASLWRTADLHQAELAAFLAYKDRLLRYLERFIADLATAAPEIARLLVSVDPVDVERLLRVVAERAALDAAPGADSTESPSGGVPSTGREEAAQSAAEQRAAADLHLAAWQARWAGLSGWFLSSAERPAQERLLRDRARAAVPALLRAVQAHHERRTGRSDRSADFRRLAVWFAEAPDDAAAHQLWHAVMGLSSSRHLTVDADTRETRSLVRPEQSWADDEPVAVSPRLRRTGSYERRGAPAQVRDRTAERAALAAALADQRAQTAAARARLATGRPTRLSEVGALDAEEFGLFLGLLSDALAAGGGTATSADGTLLVELTPVPGGALAELRTPSGTFRGPDHVLRITDALAGPAAAAATAPDASVAHQAAADR